MAVEPGDPQQKVSSWDAASVVNFLMALSALFPVLPFAMLIWFGRELNRLPDQGEMILSIASGFTFFAACSATFALPLLIPLGWFLSHRRRAQTGKTYRWWTYVLAGLLWLVFAGYSVFQLTGS